MNNEKNLEILEDLKKSVSEARYKHVIGVANMCRQLAELYNVDIERAYLAGLLHDITKDKTLTWQKSCLKRAGLYNSVPKSRNLYHSYTASIYSIKKNYIEQTDQEIINALCEHTEGSCQASDLSKILFIADKCEFGRTHQEAVNLREQFGKKSLDELYYQALKDLEQFLDSKKIKSMSKTKEAIAKYQEIYK